MAIFSIAEHKTPECLSLTVKEKWRKCRDCRNLKMIARIFNDFATFCPILAEIIAMKNGDWLLLHFFGK